MKHVAMCPSSPRKLRPAGPPRPGEDGASTESDRAGSTCPREVPMLCSKRAGPAAVGQEDPWAEEGWRSAGRGAAWEGLSPAFTGRAAARGHCPAPSSSQWPAPLCRSGLCPGPAGGHPPTHGQAGRSTVRVETHRPPSLGWARGPSLLTLDKGSFL